MDDENLDKKNENEKITRDAAASPDKSEADLKVAGKADSETAAAEAKTAAENGTGSAEDNVSEAKGQDIPADQDQQNTEDRVKDEQALKDIDVDWESEKLCRWGAARAGVIVMVPFFGSMALIANEIYMISRLADLRGIKLTEGAVAGLLGGLGATFVGQTVMTLIPFAPIQVPLGISITYGVGKAATAWIKAGHPEDVAAFREIFEQARKEGAAKVDAFKNMKCKDQPLGDESKKFNLKKMKENLQDLHLEDLKKMNLQDLDVKANEVFNKVKVQADMAESVLNQKLNDFNDHVISPMKEHGSQWISAQHLDKLSKGELVIPYAELKTFLVKAMSGSDFALLDIGFTVPERLCLLLQHKKYGTLKLELSVLDFYVGSEAAKINMKVEDFDIQDNDFATLVLETVGDKLIYAILNLVFDKADMQDGGVTASYADRIVTVDCHEMLAASKLSQKKLMGKTVLDVLHLIKLTPAVEGLQLKASITLR